MSTLICDHCGRDFESDEPRYLCDYCQEHLEVAMDRVMDNMREWCWHGAPIDVIHDDDRERNRDVALAMKGR